MTTAPLDAGAMTDEQARQMSIDMFRSATPEAVDAPIEVWRDGFEGMCGRLPVPDGTIITELAIAGVPCLQVAAAGVGRERVIIHFHSGGYVMGSPNGYRGFAARLSAVTGATVILPDYRLAPENPYPAAIDDARAIYRWVVAHHDPAALMVCGDSAGGGLCIATLMAARDDGLPLPCGAIAISPLLDLAGEGDSAISNGPTDPLVSQDLIVGMGKVYIGDRDPHEHPLASPLWGKHHGLPPLFLLVSETEALRDDVVRMEASVRAAGGSVTVSRPSGLVHIWTIFPFLRETTRAMAEIGAFARQRFGSK